MNPRIGFTEKMVCPVTANEASSTKDQYRTKRPFHVLTRFTTLESFAIDQATRPRVAKSLSASSVRSCACCEPSQFTGSHRRRAQRLGNTRSGGLIDRDRKTHV